MKLPSTKKNKRRRDDVGENNAVEEDKAKQKRIKIDENTPWEGKSNEKVREKKNEEKTDLKKEKAQKDTGIKSVKKFEKGTDQKSFSQKTKAEKLKLLEKLHPF